MDRQRHPAVQHPVVLRVLRHKGQMGPAGRANDWLATHLAVLFGVCWTIWAFFAWPLAAQFLSPAVQAKTSYYAQSWIQLFALPLMVYVGNKLQRSSDAQSEVMHQALTHVAATGDQVADRLDPGTAGGITVISDEVKALRGEVAMLVAAVRAAPGGGHAEFEQRLRAFMHDNPAEFDAMLAGLGHKPPPRGRTGKPPEGGALWRRRPSSSRR